MERASSMILSMKNPSFVEKQKTHEYRLYGFSAHLGSAWFIFHRGMLCGERIISKQPSTYAAVERIGDGKRPYSPEETLKNVSSGE